MLMRITECNMWERERWTYVLDLEKQDAYNINLLHMFVNNANKLFQTIKATSSLPFAASSYSLNYYDFYEIDKRNCVVLKNRDSSLALSNQEGGYKSGGLHLDKKLSQRRLKSAVRKLQKDKENILYKDFESLFLK